MIERIDGKDIEGDKNWNAAFSSFKKKREIRYEVFNSSHGMFAVPSPSTNSVQMNNLLKKQFGFFGNPHVIGSEGLFAFGRIR